MGSLSEAMALSAGRAHIDAKGIAQHGAPLSGRGLALKVDLRSFAETLKQVYVEGTRTAEETVKYGMILILQSCRAATPKGAANRTIETEQQPSGGTRELFNVWSQGQTAPKKVYLPRPATAQSRRLAAEAGASTDNARASIVAKFRKIERSGLGKRSWGWAMWKATGTGSGDTILRGGVVTDPIAVTRSALSIRVENALGYIDKVSPGIAQKGVDAAERKLQHWLENRWQSAMDRAVRRVA